MPPKRKHEDYFEMPSALDAEDASKTSKSSRKQTIAEAKRQNRITAQFANFMSTNGPELRRRGYNTNAMNRDWTIEKKETFMKEWKSKKSMSLVKVRPQKNQKKPSNTGPKEKRVAPDVKEGIRNIDFLVKNGSVWSDIVFGGVNAAATAISGDPAVGATISNVLKGIWNNRDVLVKAWRKIKGFFGRIFGRRNAPKALPPSTGEAIAKIAAKEMNRPVKDIAAKMRDYYSRAMKQTELGKALSGMEGQDKSVRLIDDLMNNHVIGQDEANIAKGILENDKTIQYMLDYSINSYKTIKNLLDNLTSTKDPTRIESLLKGVINLSPQNTGEMSLVPVNTGGMQTSLLSNGEFLQQVAERLNNQVVAIDQGKLEKAALEAQMKQKEEEFKKTYAALETASKQKITDLNNEKDQRTQEIQASLDQLKQDYNTLSEQNQALESQNKQNELSLVETQGELKGITSLLQNNSEFMQTIAFKNGLQVEQNNGIRSQLGLLFKLLPQLQSQLDTTANQLVQISNERDSKIVELRKAEGVIASKQQNIDNLNQSLITLQDKVTANNTLITQYKADIDKAALAVVEARKNATDEARRVAEQKLLEITSASNSEMASLREENAQLNNQITTLTQQSQGFQNEVDKYKADYQVAVQEKEAAVSARELTEAAMQKVNSLVNGIREKNHTLEQELRNMAASNAIYRENEADLKQAIAQKQDDLVAVRNQNRELARELEKYKAAARDLANMQRRTSEEKAVLEKEKSEAQQQIDRFKQEIEAWNKDEQKYYAPQKVQQAVAGLQAQVAEQENNIQQANAQMQHLDENIEIEIQRVREDADRYRHAALAVANIDPSDGSRIRPRIGTTGGAYLVGSAPDWNLGPTPSINRFWSNFYNNHYHYL